VEIIIADDDMLGITFLKRVLEKMNCTPLLAHNGIDAWNLLQTSSAKMVITDWIMPNMDGLELCKKIRATDMKKYIYIIIITAKETKSDAVKGLKAGADDYIVKPIYPDELRARIRSGQRIIKLEDDQKQASAMLFQSEKMASIGQLAAGVAHEINNPTGFVSSNLKTLTDYQSDIKDIIGQYQDLATFINELETNDNLPPQILQKIQNIINFEDEVDIKFIMDDTNQLISDCREGTDRIKKIVTDLKNFAHPGEKTLHLADINKAIESTLNVIQNEIKYHVTVLKKFGKLPLVSCNAQQLSQVFMNIFINAAQAIEKKGEIKIETKSFDKHVEIEISDTGVGIKKENISKIFDPFFTTKEIGKGTGLGMNVVYNIVKAHNGTIDVKSKVGKGTLFIIKIPIG